MICFYIFNIIFNILSANFLVHRLFYDLVFINMKEYPTHKLLLKLLSYFPTNIPLPFIWKMLFSIKSLKPCRKADFCCAHLICL